MLAQNASPARAQAGRNLRLQLSTRAPTTPCGCTGSGGVQAFRAGAACDDLVALPPRQLVPISNCGPAPRLRQRDKQVAGPRSVKQSAAACSRDECSRAMMDTVVEAASAGFLLGLASVATHTVVQAIKPPPPAARVRVRPQQPPVVLAEPLAAARGSACSACGGAGRARCVRCDGAGRLNGERAVLTRGVWPSWCKDCRGSGRTACAQCWGGGKRRGQLGFMGPL